MKKYVHTINEYIAGSEWTEWDPPEDAEDVEPENEEDVDPDDEAIKRRISEIMDEDIDSLKVSDVAYEDIRGDQSQAKNFIDDFLNSSEETELSDELKTQHIPREGGKGSTIYYYVYEYKGKKYLVMKVAEENMEYYRVVVLKDDMKFFEKEASKEKNKAVKNYDEERAEMERRAWNLDSAMGMQHRKG